MRNLKLLLKKSAVEYSRRWLAGFTYLELIIYMSIVTIMMTALIPFAWNAIEGGVKSATQREVFSQAQYVSERIKYEIRNASGIISVTPTQVSLATLNPATNPTIIASSSGNVTIQQGAGSPVVLNSQNTTISSFNFTNYSSADNLTENIQYVFTIAANYQGAGSRQEYQGSTTIEGSAEVRSNTAAPTQVTLDASSSAKVNNTTTLSWNHTTANQPNRILLVGVFTSDVPLLVTNVTYGGVPLTKLARQNCPLWCGDDLWYLINPAPGVNVPIVVTASLSNAIAGGAATFYNVNTTNPFGTIAAAAGTSLNAPLQSSSLPVTSTANQLVVDSWVDDDGDIATPGSGQSLIWNINGTDTGSMGSNKPGGTGNVTWSWPSDGDNAQWADIAIPVNPAASSGSPTSTPTPTPTPTPGGSPTFEVASAAQIGKANSFTWSHTVGYQSNRLLVVGVSVDNPGASITVTYGGAALTRLVAMNCSSACRDEFWYKVNPPSGTANVVVTNTGNDNVVLGSASYYNTNQATPFASQVTTSGTGISGSGTVTASASQLAVDSFATSAMNGTWSPQAGQTKLWADSTVAGGGASYRSGAGSTTMTWKSDSSTGDQWAEIVAVLQ